jgi:hypothetical protein
MELYIFLITVLVRLITAMVVVLSCFYGEGSYPSYLSVGTMCERTIRHMKRVMLYRKLKTEEVLGLIKEIKSSEAGAVGAKTCTGFNKTVENENVII